MNRTSARYQRHERRTITTRAKSKTELKLEAIKKIVTVMEPYSAQNPDITFLDVVRRELDRTKRIQWMAQGWHYGGLLDGSPAWVDHAAFFAADPPWYSRLVAVNQDAFDFALKAAMPENLREIRPVGTFTRRHYILFSDGKTALNPRYMDIVNSNWQDAKFYNGDRVPTVVVISGGKRVAIIMPVDISGRKVPLKLRQKLGAAA